MSVIPAEFTSPDTEAAEQHAAVAATLTDRELAESAYVAAMQTRDDVDAIRQIIAVAAEQVAPLLEAVSNNRMLKGMLGL